MFLTSSEKLKEKIVHIVAGDVGLSAGKIMSALSRKGHLFSKPALYKELRALLEDSVLIKAHQKYYLSVDWTVKLQQFNDQVKSQMGHPQMFEDIYLQGRTKRTWRLSSLVSAKHLWSKLVGEALSQSENKLSLSWNPCPWFYYSQPHHQSALMQHHRKCGARMYKIMGTSGFNPHFLSTFWHKDFVTWSTNSSRYHGDECTYFTVIDNFYIECNLSKATAKSLVDVCQKSKESDVKKLALLYAIEQKKTRVTITLNKSARIANKHTNYFNEYFGTLEHS